MHAQGNDFVILESDKLTLQIHDYSLLARAMCDRHFGIGADGLVLLDKSLPQMIIYNTDGTRAEMCGSALRCCCYLMYKHSGSFEVSINTDSGVSKGYIDRIVPEIVTVEIGNPEMILQNMIVDSFTGDYVNIGNPHFVILSDDLSAEPHLTYGKALSKNKAFTNGANVEFVSIINRDEIDVVVWERGVGATLACGTGSTAVVFSCQVKGLLNDSVKVNLPGGKITVERKDSVYYLQGEVVFVATGEYLWKV
jgi:diaminopimelate epimerase